MTMSRTCPMDRGERFLPSRDLASGMLFAAATKTNNMKKLLMLASFAPVIILTCNNDHSSGSGHSDTTSHATEGANGGHHMPSQQPDSSSASMMDMMNKTMAGMKAVPSSGSPDNDFAALMKVHHMGALDMARAEIANGTSAELKTMAQQMVQAQEREIAELNTFISGQQTREGGDAFYREAMKQMDEMKMDMDHSGSYDAQFAKMMIPHHQGAIDMSKAYLKANGKEEKLKAMAKKIITDQEKEIGQLQKWLSSSHQN